MLNLSWKKNWNTFSSLYQSTGYGRGNINITSVRNMRKEKIIGKQNIFILTDSFLFQPITFCNKVYAVQNKWKRSQPFAWYFLVLLENRFGQRTKRTQWKQTTFLSPILIARCLTIDNIKSKSFIVFLSHKWYDLNAVHKRILWTWQQLKVLP